MCIDTKETCTDACSQHEACRRDCELGRLNLRLFLRCDDELLRSDAADQGPCPCTCRHTCPQPRLHTCPHKHAHLCTYKFEHVSARVNTRAHAHADPHGYARLEVPRYGHIDMHHYTYVVTHVSTHVRTYVDNLCKGTRARPAASKCRRQRRMAHRGCPPVCVIMQLHTCVKDTILR